MSDRPSLQFYLDQLYPVTIVQNPDGGYFAAIQDLPGCMTDADTVEEAWSLIQDCRILWLEASYEKGGNIPLPSRV